MNTGVWSLAFLAALALCHCASIHLDIDMEESAPATLGNIGRCDKDGHMGVVCTGMDDGENVTVSLSLDEICRTGTLMIVARFTIGGDVSFERYFGTNKSHKYCQMVTQKKEQYCFKVDVDEHRCPRCDEFRACLAITKPRRLNFGCFVLDKPRVNGDRALPTDEAEPPFLA